MSDTIDTHDTMPAGEGDDVASATPSDVESGEGGNATRGYAALMVITGFFGLISAVALTIDYINSLRDPGYVPSCDLNPLIGCGEFLGSPQASAFGFPNVIIGMVAFSVVIAIGAVLLTRAVLPQWFWRGMVAGVTFGIGFVTWLQYQSFNVIGGLCPYCMVVWTAMIPLFVHTVARAAENGSLPVGEGLSSFLVRYRWALTFLWYLAVIVAAMFGLGDALLLMF